MTATFVKGVKGEIRFVGICLLISIVQTYFTCSSCIPSLYRYSMVTLFTVCMWYFLWRGNALLSCLLDKKVTWLNAPVKRFILGTLVMMVYSVGIIMLTMELFGRAFNFYLGSSSRPTLIISVIFTLIVSLFIHGRWFLINWRKLELDAVKMRNENLSSRYESLKSQVDPHFLFNSLNVLTTLVYEDADKSARFIKKLSEVYRYVLDTRAKELVSLQEELDFVDAYLYLQQIRFGAKLRVEKNITAREGVVPPLVVQMLVENAIKHNVIAEENPLTIRIAANDQTITVANNLQVKKLSADESRHIGLENIRKRYEFFTSTAIEIRKGENDFVVSLPLLKLHNA